MEQRNPNFAYQPLRLPNENRAYICIVPKGGTIDTRPGSLVKVVTDKTGKPVLVPWTDTDTCKMVQDAICAAVKRVTM